MCWAGSTERPNQDWPMTTAPNLQQQGNNEQVTKHNTRYEREWEINTSGLGLWNQRELTQLEMYVGRTCNNNEKTMGLIYHLSIFL